MDECPFCVCPADRVVDANSLAYVVEDAVPVSPGHTLVIPRRHIESVFDLWPDETNAILELLGRAKARLDHFCSPAGFNIGVNIGRAAGQTVMHAHVHLIPRFTGDVHDPEGGVRNVIPGMGSYS